MTEAQLTVADIIIKYHTAEKLLKSGQVSDDKRDDVIRDYINGYMLNTKNKFDPTDLLKRLLKFNDKFNTPIPDLKEKSGKMVLDYLDIEKTLKKTVIKREVTLTEEEKEMESLIITTIKNEIEIREPNVPNIADYFIKKYNIVSIKGNLYINRNGIYYPDNDSKNVFTRYEAFKLCKKLNLSNVNAYVGYAGSIAAALEIINPFDEPPFNKEEGILNCKNGLLKFDFEKGVVNLIPHTEQTSHKFTYQIPLEYDPSISTAWAIDFFKRFDEGEENKISELLIQFGAHLIIQICFPEYNFKQSLYTLHGDTDRGKTAITSTNKKIFGKQNIGSMSLDRLGERFSTSALYGKILNISDDLTQKPITDYAKTVTGGGTISIEFKNKTPFQAELNMLHMFTTNKMPRMTNADEAMYQRFIYIHLTKKFKKDPKFERDLTNAMLQSIFNLYIEEAFKLFNSGFELKGTDTWQEMRRQSYLDNNILHRFVQKYLLITGDKNDVVIRSDFYKKFKQVCEDEYYIDPNEIPSINSSEIQKYMDQHGHNGEKDKEIIIGRTDYPRCWIGMQWNMNSGIDNVKLRVNTIPSKL